MKEKISCLQLSSMMILVLVSSFIGTGTYSSVKAAGVDAYISIIIALVFGLPLLLLFLYLSSYEPSLSFPQKLEKLYGKVVGKIVIWIFIIFAFIMATSHMFNLTNFIVSQFLPETPLLVIGIAFSFVIIYVNLKGIEAIARIAIIILTINLILFFIGGLGLIPSFSMDNLKPILEFGIGRPIYGAFYIITLTLVPIFLFLIIPKNTLIDSKKFNRYTTLSYVLSLVLMFITVLLSLGVLGIYLASIYQYPEYIVLKHVNLFNFLDRIENIITAQWIFGLFFTVTFDVYFICNSIKWKHKSKMLPCLITLISLLASVYLIPNNTMFIQNVYHIVSQIRVIFIFCIIILAISVFIKVRKKKRNNPVSLFN